MELFTANVYLPVPLSGLLQQGNAAVVRRLGSVAPRLGPQRRDELRNGNPAKGVHLTRVLLKRVIRLRSRAGFVYRGAVKRACRFLLGVVVAVFEMGNDGDFWIEDESAA
jgi:hypothetical protein|tara:strand:+ start:560 stop:889 length:330 start_codon:yes stop_codon:yes gene_type:complete